MRGDEVGERRVAAERAQWRERRGAVGEQIAAAALQSASVRRRRAG